MNGMHKKRGSLRFGLALALVSLAGLIVIGCGSGAEPSPAVPTSLPESGPEGLITLGDIDAGDPVKKIKRFRPLPTI